MVVYIKLFLIIISSSFVIFRAAAGPEGDLKMIIYNIGKNDNTTFDAPHDYGKYYYFNEGDDLRIKCIHKKYRNGYLPKGTALMFYYCKDGTWKNKTLNGCLATKHIFTAELISKLYKDKLLSKTDDDSAMICQYTDKTKWKYRLFLRLFLYPDPPTIIINNKQFNKSLSKTNIYEGKLGEKLDIVCQKNKMAGKLQWEYFENTQDTSYPTPESTDKQIINSTLELDEKHNGTEIKCVLDLNTEKNITSVFLRVRSEIKTGSSRSNTTIWLLIGGGTSVVVILVIIIIKLSLKKKSDQTTDDEEITYENLINDAPIPPTFPNSDKLEDIYLKPPGSQNENSTQQYNDANVYDLYSKPLPKSLRNPTFNIQEYHKKI